MSKFIRTTFNLKEDTYDGTEYYDLETQPSLTDPSQAMEIKDILREFSRGGSVRILRSQEFGEEIPAEFQHIAASMHKMDRTEKAEAIQQITNMVNEKSDKIDLTKKKVEKAKIQAKARAEAKAEAEKAKNPKGGE